MKKLLLIYIWGISFFLLACDDSRRRPSQGDAPGYGADREENVWDTESESESGEQRRYEDGNQDDLRPDTVRRRERQGPGKQGEGQAPSGGQNGQPESGAGDTQGGQESASGTGNNSEGNPPSSEDTENPANSGANTNTDGSQR